jgi:predicted dehydrogenase
MATSKRVSRRKFLAGSAAALAAPLILPSSAHAKPGNPGPNDRVGIGYVSVGRRARQLMGLPKGTEIVAISDVNQPRLDEVAGDKGWKQYHDYRDMLQDDAVDAVIVASPDHWHALHSIQAYEAGKDVYCEKPMTLTVREGRAMVKAARKNKSVTQTGSQQRSMSQCRHGCELIRNGYLGDISIIHAANYPSPWECDLPEQPVPEGLNWDMWCGQTEPRPYHIELYTPRVRGHEAGWISYRPYSGGEMTGWGAHGLDMIQWALGTDESGPVEVEPLLDTEREDAVHKGPNCEVRFKYANGVVVHLGKGPGGGGIFEGSEGTLLIDRGKCESKPENLAAIKLKDSDIHLYESSNHLQNWVDCIRSRERCIADVEIGHRSATMCHLGNIARWTKRPLKWDPEKEIFPGDDEANGYLERPMRSPYRI